MRILIVDDEQDVADSMAMVLEGYGHETFVSYSVVDGLEKARRLAPDAILHDLAMPYMSGFEAVELLRAEPQFKHTLILAVTAYGSQSDRERAQLAGFNALLVKPVPLALLERALNRE